MQSYLLKVSQHLKHLNIAYQMELFRQIFYSPYQNMLLGDYHTNFLEHTQKPQSKWALHL